MSKNGLVVIVLTCLNCMIERQAVAAGPNLDPGAWTERMRTSDIVVWVVSPNGPAESDWSYLESLLDATERDRGRRFFAQDHRRRHVVAHALKRLMLSASVGLPPQSWAFEIEPGGKPRVAPNARPYFNIAHCDTLVACAVSEKFEIGIDVEAIGRAVPHEVAERYFAERERRWINDLSPSQRAPALLRLWTLKEAFVKATGRGLAQSLQSFSFTLDPLDVDFLDPSLGNSRDWHFEQHELDGHLLALAARGARPAPPVEIRQKRLESLIAEAIAIGIGRVSSV